MSSTLLLISGLALFGVAVATAMMAAFWGSGRAHGVARSLELINYRPTQGDVSRADLPITERILVPMLDRSRGLATRLSPGGTAERIASSLERAGNPPGWSVERVMGMKGVALVVGVLLGLLLFGVSPRGIIVALIAGGVLFWIPDVLAYNLGLRRQDEIRKGLADALDMLTVCVEAGQGFDSSLLQVARAVSGPISGEFARVLSEIQIGVSRSEAFAAMAERTTAPEVKNFVSALVQADRLGLPIGAVLREQSAQMRVNRRQRAEAQAQKVTVKILFPLLLCIFPALFIVIIGPGAIRIVEAFSRL